MAALSAVAAVAPPLEHYSLDGRGNSREHPAWGGRMAPELRRYGRCHADTASAPRFVADPANPNATTEGYGRCVSHCRAFQAAGAPGRSWSHGGLPPFIVDAKASSCAYGCNDLLGANARNISRRVFSGARRQALSEKRANDLHSAFGRLVSHETHRSLEGGEAWPVRVPACDEWFDPDCSGSAVLGFERLPTTGEGAAPVNVVSAWIDGNVIYGGDDAGDPSVFNWLRNGDPADAAFHSCKLRVVDRPEFPNSPAQYSEVPSDARGYPQFSFAGNASIGGFRGNVDPGVLSLITVFTRYHNLICDKIAASSPGRSAEDGFWEARKWVVATLQRIFFYEYIPALVGKPLPQYTGYAAHEDPALDVYHTMAAMRFGYSEVNELFLRLDEGWQTHPAGHLSCRDAVLSPGRALEAGLDALLRGLLSQAQGRVDAYVIHDLVNGHLALPSGSALWAGGHSLARSLGSSPTARGLFDLQAATIQRGREQGLCGLNAVRYAMGLRPHGSWQELVLGEGWAETPASHPGRVLAEDLRELYGPEVDSGDFWVAGLVERRSGGDSSLGETFTAVLVDGWARLRLSDRFHFENSANGLFTRSEVDTLLKTSLSDVVRSVTGVDVPGQAFFVPSAPPAAAAPALPDFAEFRHVRQLGPFFRLAWAEVPGEEALDFGVAAPTLGWVGVGFAGAAHAMMGADVVLGRVLGGAALVEDMYASDLAAPVRDEEREPPGRASLSRARVVQQNGVTSVYFRKPVGSGDPWDGLERTATGRVRLVFAFQPQGMSALEYHGAMRGEAEVQLFDPSCPEGTFLSAAAMECRLCAPGSHRAEHMPAASCERCPRGSFQPAAGGASCVGCASVLPGSTTQFLGALAADECVCPVGTYSAGAAERCELCGEGLYCPGGAGEPQQELGFHVEVLADSPLKLSVWECHFKSSCPRGPMGACSSGTSGLMCAVCHEPDHYWDTGRKACLVCSGSRSAWFVALAVIALVLGMVLLYKVSLVWGDAEALSDPLELGVAFALMVFLGQSSSVYGCLNIAWGSPLDDLLTVSSLFTLDFHSTNVDCSWGFDLFEQYLTGSLIPLLILLLYFVAALMLRRFYDRRDAPLRCWNSAGLIFHTFFIGFVLHGVQPFILHQQPNGKHSIRTLPGLVLETPEHVFFAAVGVLHLLFYGGGFIAYSIFACLQLRARARLGTARGIRAVLWHRFIYIKFRPSRFYWSVVQLARNTLLALIPAIFDEPYLQLVILMALLCTCCCVHSYYWPYKSTSHNLADLAGTLALMALALSAAFFLRVEDDFDTSVVVFSVGVAFMFIVVLVVVLLFCVLVVLARTKLQTREQRQIRAEASLRKRTSYYAELQQVAERDLSVLEAEWRGIDAETLCSEALPCLSATSIIKVEGPLPPDLASASRERLAMLEIDFIAPSEHPFMKAVQACMQVLEERLRCRIQETMESSYSKSPLRLSRSQTLSLDLPDQIKRLDIRSFSRVIWNRGEQEQIAGLCARVMEFNAAFVDVFRAEEPPKQLLQIFVSRMESKFRGVYQACLKDMLSIQPGFARAVSAAKELNAEAQLVEDRRDDRYEILDRNFSSYAGFMQAAVRTQEATFLYAKSVAGATGGSVTRTSAKHLYRILEKLALDPKVAAGEQAHAWDAARMMVLYENMEGIARGVEHILADHRFGEVEVVRIKDRFSEPTGGGWSDILVNLRFPSSCKELSKLPFELQLAVTQMMVIRKEMGGHHGYAKYRSGKEILELLTYTPEQLVQSIASSSKAKGFIRRLSTSVFGELRP